MKAIGFRGRLKAVIFDLDDTLYEHATFVRGAYRDVSRVFGEATSMSASAFDAEAWRQYEISGSRDNRIFSRLLEKHGVYSRRLERLLVDAYRRHFPCIRPYSGVEESLMILREKGFRLAMLSDGRPDVQRRKIDSLGLSGAFDVVVITGELRGNVNKPDPGVFSAVLEKMKIGSREAVMIGDDPNADIAGALTAGMPALRVMQGQYKNEHKPVATGTFENVPETVRWIVSERR